MKTPFVTPKTTVKTNHSTPKLISRKKRSSEYIGLPKSFVSTVNICDSDEGSFILALPQPSHKIHLQSIENRTSIKKRSAEIPQTLCGPIASVVHDFVDDFSAEKAVQNKKFKLQMRPRMISTVDKGALYFPEVEAEDLEVVSLGSMENLALPDIF